MLTYQLKESFENLKNAGLTINRFVTVTASDIKLFLTLTITVTKTSMVQSSLSQGLTKTNLFQTTSYDGWNRTETKNDITLIEKNSVMMIKSLKNFSCRICTNRKTV